VYLSLNVNMIKKSNIPGVSFTRDVQNVCTLFYGGHWYEVAGNTNWLRVMSSH
jgi:hypothetical protein